MRIENVLVPMDFSPPSRLALDYAIALARQFLAKVTLMHVLESGAALSAGFPQDKAAAEGERRERALRRLSSLVAPEDQDDLDLRIVLKTGGVQDEIFPAIKEHGADMLVMGTHGRGLLGRWFIGSVTESILRKVHIPVLTVCHSVSPVTFRRILFATDLSAASQNALSFVFEFARKNRSEVVIFHAAGPASLTFGGADMVGYASQHNKEEAETVLVEMAAEGKRQGVKVETVLAEGAAAKEILEACEQNDVDLILITIESKGLLERAFLGSTAEHIVRDAHIPVLSIPAGASAGAERMAEISSSKR